MVKVRRGILDEKTVLAIFFYLICLTHIYYLVIRCANNIFIIFFNGLGLDWNVQSLRIKYKTCSPYLYLLHDWLFVREWIIISVELIIQLMNMCVVLFVMWCVVLRLNRVMTHIHKSSIVNSLQWKFMVWCSILLSVPRPDILWICIRLTWVEDLKSSTWNFSVRLYNYTLLWFGLATNQPYRLVFLHCGLLILGYKYEV